MSRNQKLIALVTFIVVLSLLLIVSALSNPVVAQEGKKPTRTPTASTTPTATSTTTSTPTQEPTRTPDPAQTIEPTPTMQATKPPETVCDPNKFIPVWTHPNGCEIRDLTWDGSYSAPGVPAQLSYCGCDTWDVSVPGWSIVQVNECDLDGWAFWSSLPLYSGCQKCE